MNEQVRPASWFVKLTRVRGWPEGSAGGRIAGKTDKPKDYEPRPDYSFSCNSAALFGRNAVNRWQALRAGAMPCQCPCAGTDAGGTPMNVARGVGKAQGGCGA
jgi:hypothetical protein